MSLCDSLRLVSSDSCGIELGEFFITTGGLGESGRSSTFTVSKYNRAGWVADLMFLNTARRRHACGSYRNAGNQDVLLVTGGWGDGGVLSSTEISEDQGVMWTTLQSALPKARDRMKAVTYNNRLLIFGIKYILREANEIYLYLGGRKSSKTTRSILEFIPFNKTMVEVGQMTMGRHSHAVSIIDNVDQFCPTFVCPGIHYTV